MIYFTSDTHFGSQRTLELSKRPFANVGEMDFALMTNWNKTVSQEDVVYHLGDFGNYNMAQYLNGTKKIEVPTTRRKGNGKFIELKGAKTNNLKKINPPKWEGIFFYSKSTIDSKFIA